MRLGEFFGQTIDVIEVAVGLVLVLFVKLSIVEGFVVKFGCTIFMFNRIIWGGCRFNSMGVRNCAEVSTLAFSAGKHEWNAYHDR